MDRNPSPNSLIETTATNMTEPKRKPVPTLYESDESKYVGPHRWQIQPWAKWVRRAWHQRAYQRWIDQACNHIEIAGSEHLPMDNTPCVFIGNHSSHLDTLLVQTAMPNAIRQRLYYGAAQDRWFVKGKAKLSLQPWYQSLALGNFPIMRGGGVSALDHAHWLLQQGQHVFLFPEGTRAQGDTLGEFKHGAAILAKANQAPILPIYLSGLQSIRPKGSRHATPGGAGLQILPPILPKAHINVAQLTQQAQAALNAVHAQHHQQQLIQAPPAVDQLAA